MTGLGRVFVIAQAKTGSKRLPRKVLLPLAGRPVAEWVIRRAARAKVDGVVLAIPEGVQDDPLQDLGVRKKCTVYRGDTEDVQARYLGAANAVKATTIVRLTCDNPFVDATLIDGALVSHRQAQADFSSYMLAPPFPLGFSVEVFSLGALRRARKLSSEPFHREHVTPTLYQNAGTFTLNPVEPPPAFRRDDVRLTLDTPEDYAAMTALVALAGEDPMAVAAERYLSIMVDHPEIRALNAHVRQKRLGE